jgi:hypothetical protein
MRGKQRRLASRPWLAIATLAVAAWGCGAGAETKPDGTGGSGGTGGAPEAPMNHPASEPCTVVPQGGCPASHTCLVATVDGATICQGAGFSPLGGWCAASTDCAPGLSCIGSVCMAFCYAPGDCGGVAPACIQIFYGDQPVNGWLTCSIPCNPADPQNTAALEGVVGCPGGMGCFELDPSIGPQGSTSCYWVGQGGAFAPCESVEDCAPGLICLNDGALSCRPLCILGQSPCNCLSFAQPMHAAISGAVVEVGYCQ